MNLPVIVFLYSIGEFAQNKWDNDTKNEPIIRNQDLQMNADELITKVDEILGSSKFDVKIIRLCPETIQKKLIMKEMWESTTE